SVGIVKKNKIINGSTIKVGDALVGIASSGIHSNGFSLVRKLFGEDKKSLNTFNATLGCAPADIVLTPTRIYVKTILSLIEKFEIKGIAHITGGGFIENVPRILPSGLGVYIDRSSYPLPKVFKALQEIAEIDDRNMCNTFNMGIGMVLAVDPAIANDVVAELEALGEKAWTIGKVTDKEGVVL
ncbi:MAG: AIR synthase-related protein, partial [Clostridia bacterium]